jgi:hypothetical protein
MSMYLPNLDELSFRIVFALPKAETLLGGYLYSCHVFLQNILQLICEKISPQKDPSSLTTSSDFK